MILCLTERLIIREYEDSDADSIVRIVNNEGIYRTTYAIPRDYSKKRAKWWINIFARTQKTELAMNLECSLKRAENILVI